ncbi:MAG: cytochrome b [Pseudorhodobacter sp.]
MKTTTGYSTTQILLHWLIALGILINYVTSDGMGNALDQTLAQTLVTSPMAGLHVWTGVTVLALVLIRILLRALRGAPAPETGLMGRAASLTHIALYLLMILVPFSGAMAWFGGVQEAGDMHELLVNLLMIVVLAHAVAALFHHYILKDGVMRRIMRPN